MVLRVVLVAIAVGTAGALLLTRFLATFLFGAGQHDAVVFIIVPTAVTLTSLIAVWLPARTIANVDTLRALRSE